MKRDILDNLMSWKTCPHRKPIILRGARQVGKTTVVRQLGKSFRSFVEVNFEETPEVASFFESSLNPTDIMRHLQNYFTTNIEDGSTLLFF